MGFFNFIEKKKHEKQEMTYMKMLDGSLPIYSQFGTNIYASDVVNQALYAIVKEMSKLNPKHVREQGFDVIPVDGSVQQVLDDPNYLMTTTEFIEKIVWQYLLNYNAFVYIQKDASDTLIGLYPLSPTNVTFVEDRLGLLYVKMRFNNGYEQIIPYDRLIHIRSHYSVNDLMGGDETGQPNNQPLLRTLQLNDILLNGVKKALNGSFAINGIVKYNTVLGGEKMETAIKEFEDRLKNANSGLLGLDNKAEVIQLKRDIKIIDDATLKFIDDKILRNFGVPIEIIRGNYTPQIYEAFYQSTLENIIIAISQGFTKRIFTKREKGFKNKIKLYPKELIFMNTSQTIAMVNLLGQSGSLFENEKRVAFGYAPSADLVGVRMQSLNYVNVEYAREYQMSQKSKTSPKEGEKDD